jgi:hypothetical protein
MVTQKASFSTGDYDYLLPNFKEDSQSFDEKVLDQVVNDAVKKYIVGTLALKNL